MSIRVLIAPSGFKESLGPDEVADCIEVGILRALPDARVYKAPLVDGGEGFTKALVQSTKGSLHSVAVTGPLGQPVVAHYGFLGGLGPKTAVLEMASAAGLRLVSQEARDPLKTTTYGVGELIKAALDGGAERILIGCADSGTTDGGAGMAQALGVRLLDGSGNDIRRGGDGLRKLDQIDISGCDSRIREVQIDVACNLNTVLCGPEGAARVFGPQKGASPEAVEHLAAALERYAAVIFREFGIDPRPMPGGGAAGGLGTALHVFLNARLRHRFDIVMQYLEVDSPLSKADLVITGEGCIDFTTPRGKIPTEVARRAKPYNLPVVALVGMMGRGAQDILGHGIDSFSTILETPTTLPDAMENASLLLTRATERIMRSILVGRRLPHLVTTEDSETAVPLDSREEEIRDRAVDLDGASAPKPDFLSTVSHELRTPLSLVMGYTAMVKDGLLGELNPVQEKALDQVVRHSLGLLTVIDGMLPPTHMRGEAVKQKDHEPARSDDRALRTNDKG